MKSEDKKLAAEQWLDDALENYSAAEPRAGIEMRILANLEAHVSQRRRRWVLALAASAAVVVFAMVMVNLRGSRQVAPNNVASQTPLEIKSINATPAVSIRRQRANAPLAHDQRATAHKNVTGNKTVLAGVKQKQSPVDKQLFAQEQPSLQNDLNQASEQVPEPIIAQERPAPEIYVSDLKKIQPIEVRELAPVKDIN
ncbi:MAG TPA: hypothetical protein VK699_00760 [Terriglobales bacterium]|jgi:hypothetical protein|nr:hypothetical protein [Terriglobales bacterium]